MLKRVQAHSHHPVAYWRSEPQPWCDVDISFKARPGRRVYRYWLTLMSRSDIESDLSMKTGDPLGDLRGIQLALKDSAIHIAAQRGGPRMPHVFTSAEYIDRPIAEVMLRAFMAQLGLRRTKFVWRKPASGFLSIPC